MLPTIVVYPLTVEINHSKPEHNHFTRSGVVRPVQFFRANGQWMGNDWMFVDEIARKGRRRQYRIVIR